MSIDKAQFKKLIKKYEKMDYNELIEQGRTSYLQLYPIFLEFDKKTNSSSMLLSLLNTGIGADGKFTKKEKQFLFDAFKIQPDTVEKMIEEYSGKSLEFFKMFYKAVPAALKLHIVHLICVLAACDDTISRDESKYILELLEQ